MRTFILGAGADTVVFESVAANNGADIITNFTAGSGNDVLAISGLLGSAFGGTSKFVAASAGTGAGDLDTSGTQVLIHAGSSAIDTTTGSSNMSFSTTDSISHYKIGGSQKLFVVDTVNNANILYLVDGSTVAVTKVGTLNAGDDIADTLAAGNFGDVA